MASRGVIYLVDSDPSVRDGISRFLHTVGYSVHVFESLKDLLRWREPLENGCLMLEINTEGLSTSNMSASLSGDFFKLPIVFLSADMNPKTREQARPSRASAYFHKPIDGPALVDAIEWAILSNENAYG